MKGIFNLSRLPVYIHIHNLHTKYTQAHNINITIVECVLLVRIIQTYHLFVMSVTQLICDTIYGHFTFLIIGTIDF